MELKINDYKLLCNKGSANFNEDIIGLSPYGAWVLDGATGLNNKNLVSNESDAKWYVNWWNKYLHENMKRNDSLKEIMKDGIDEITKEYYKLIGDNKVEALDFPSCACSLVKFYEDKIECYSLVNTIHGYEREELNHANYILDTVYRTVSFSKSSYLPRSYNQFINEDMGQKK